MGYPSGKVVTYTPTDRDLMNTVALTAGGTTINYVQKGAYTALGGPSFGAHGNGPYAIVENEVVYGETFAQQGKAEVFAQT